MSKHHFRMPAEWEPHQATWLSWPHNIETWPENILPRIEELFAKMATELSHGEEVRINVADQEMEKRARSALRQLEVDFSKVFFHHFPTNDAWVRDHGPQFIIQEKSAKNQVGILDWEYNAWGNKYPPFDLDNAIPGQISEALGLSRWSPEMVLEGGSIEVNGRGTLLTTEQCLLHPNRNPQMSKEEIEEMLKHYLGVKKILWLGEGIVGDDTDGHIDDITRFVAADTVLTAVEENSEDENFKPLQENLIRLQGMTDQDERPLKIITLPMPGAVFHKGERLPASYANFYIGNKVVLVPIFSDPLDQAALKILQGLFSQRRVVGIDSRELAIGLGGIHCVTQQLPSILVK